MGLRLLGEPLRVPPRELVSEPVCPGAVQVTRDGQCIVLGVDGQTIGGYPKVGQVIAADLDLLGQVRPGDRVWFERVEVGKQKGCTAAGGRRSGSGWCGCVRGRCSRPPGRTGGGSRAA